jgi:hypothetical protein
LRTHNQTPGRAPRRASFITTCAALAAAAFLGIAGTARAEGESAANPAAKPVGNAVEQVDAFIATQTIDKTNARWRTTLPKPTVADFAAGKTYTWVLDTTQGKIKVELLPKAAPMHVTSTIYLTQLSWRTMRCRYSGVRIDRNVGTCVARP